VPCFAILPFHEQNFFRVVNLSQFDLDYFIHGGLDIAADKAGLDGKFAIVTGGYVGVGLETTRALASAGAKVIVPARSMEKARTALAGIAGVFGARRHREHPTFWWMIVTLAAASTFVMFPASLWFWRHLPELQFLQFPWRWLVPLGIPYAFFLASAISQARWRWIWYTALALVIVATATAIVHDAWWDSEDIPVLMSAIRSQHGYEGTDEYEPLGSDRYQLPGQPPASADDSDESSLNESAKPAAPMIATIDPESDMPAPMNNENAHIDRWSAETKMFTSKTNHPVALALRLLNYPAWEIKVDGTIVHADSLPETAQLSLQEPAGQHSVDVFFQRTEDRTAGSAISILSVFLLLGFSTYSRRKSSQGALNMTHR